MYRSRIKSLFLLPFFLFQLPVADSFGQSEARGTRETFKQENAYVIRNIEGWSVKVDKKLVHEEKETGDRALKALSNHLQRIEFILPKEKVAELRKLPIWVEFRNHQLKNMQYHPGKGWLINNEQNPELVKHVHIPVASALYDRQMWAKHPYVVLHELAHAYHDQVLGFGHREIRKTYEQARKSGTYDRILDHRGVTLKHYGMNNEKEYFAESTEAYLGVNDFYPFVRAELKKHDPGCYALMEKIWGKIK